MENQENENKNLDDSDTLEENEINFAEVKKNFLKSFDETVNQNKEKIKQMTSIFQRMDEIFKQARTINGDIKNLETLTQSIIEKQHKEYINTFISFMDNVRKELTKKLEEMEKLAETKKKANDIRVIKTERDFFKAEAIRLNSICKNFKAKIDELTFNGKLLTDELSSLKIKWKESENINKQLLFELESNIQSQKELEQKFNETQSILNEQRNTQKNIESENMNITEKQTKLDILEEQLIKTRIELKREKERANKALYELNKMYLEKNKYELIFQKCVEETKKMIFNRRVKENKAFKIKNRTGIGKYDYKVNLSTKFDNFLPTDKINTLENFIFNEEVFNMVKEIIFSKPKKKIKNIENTKNIINSFKYFEPDWKMKEIVENANENGDNITQKIPVINLGRSNSVLGKKSITISKAGDDTISNNANQTHQRKLPNIGKRGNYFGSTSRLSVDLKIN